MGDTYRAELRRSVRALEGRLTHGATP
jgi:hypothetical protein